MYVSLFFGVVSMMCLIIIFEFVFMFWLFYKIYVIGLGFVFIGVSDFVLWVVMMERVSAT